MRRGFRNILVVLLVSMAVTSVFAQSNITIQARANVHLEMGTTVTVGSLTVDGSATGPGYWKLSLTSVEQRFGETQGTIMSAVPDRYQLNQNYPNPFNPFTTIVYALPAESHVCLTVFNLLGQKVEELVNELQPAGWQEVRWNGTASGIFFYRIDARGSDGRRFTEVKRMVLIR